MCTDCGWSTTTGDAQTTSCNSGDTRLRRQRAGVAHGLSDGRAGHLQISDGGQDAGATHDVSAR